MLLTAVVYHLTAIAATQYARLGRVRFAQTAIGAKLARALKLHEILFDGEFGALPQVEIILVHVLTDSCCFRARRE